MKRAIATAMMPIGPAPVINTSSPTTLKDSAAWVALPSGSSIEAISSEMPAGSRNTFEAGSTMYSAKQPGRSTPTPWELRHRWRRPARQLRQWPQVMWPSPETRSPTASPRTSLPVATISPQYSWPTCIGTGIVRRAQSSHCQMWMSVPQIAVLRMRISTSFGPGTGFGSSPSQIPGSGRDLIRACMVLSLAGHAELAPGLDKGLRRGFEHLARVARAHLSPDPRLAHRHDRVREADGIHAELEQAVRHAHGERGVADHHRNDRMLAGQQPESRGRKLRPEPGGVLRELLARPGRGLEEIEHGEGRRRDHRRDGVREQVGPRALPEPGDDRRATGHVAAAGAAERLAERAGQHVDASDDA